MLKGRYFGALVALLLIVAGARDLRADHVEMCGDPGALINDLYRNLLGREAEPAGLEAWKAVLIDNQGDRRILLRGVLFSPEAMQSGAWTKDNNAFVGILYNTILGREVDQSEYQGWVHLLNTGTTRENVIEQIMWSPEARALQQQCSVPQPDAQGKTGCIVEFWEDAGFNPRYNNSATIREDRSDLTWIGTSMYYNPKTTHDGILSQPLHETKINDSMSSARILRGSARFCVDSGFNGQCIGPFGKGASIYDFAAYPGMNDKVSSIECFPYQ